MFPYFGNPVFRVPDIDALEGWVLEFGDNETKRNFRFLRYVLTYRETILLMKTTSERDKYLTTHVLTPIPEGVSLYMLTGQDSFGFILPDSYLVPATEDEVLERTNELWMQNWGRVP